MCLFTLDRKKNKKQKKEELSKNIKVSVVKRLVEKIDNNSGKG